MRGEDPQDAAGPAHAQLDTIAFCLHKTTPDILNLNILEKRHNDHLVLLETKRSEQTERVRNPSTTVPRQGTVKSGLPALV
eukprot:11858044-Heterocapsa_arctica.AAC.1